MAKVFIEESTLTSIGDAIRSKTATADLMSPAAMPAVINSIGSGADIPPEGLIITGHCDYTFKGVFLNWYLTLDGVTTNNITSAVCMFYRPAWESATIDSIPFDINIAKGCDCSSMFYQIYIRSGTIPAINGAIGNGGSMFCNSKLTNIPDLTFDNSYSSGHDYDYMFSGCNKLKTIGTLTNMKPNDMDYMFSRCSSLRELPQFVNLDVSKLNTCNSLFDGCVSLRSIPEELFQQLSTVALFGNTFGDCYALDEIRGFNQHSLTLTGYLNSQTFFRCYRVKDIIFATQEDGTPYSANWKSQTIDLTSSRVGYAPVYNSFSGPSAASGIPAGKEVTDAATYAALKNDPDWWTREVAYSRYNHTSAVNTINSLPDTSAYLAANGGTNTIKFVGAAGSATDGGAINTLTAEEIAVAAAKGWTVTLS